MVCSRLGMGTVLEIKMYAKLFCKPLEDFDNDFLSQIKESDDHIWWTAKNNPDGSLTFVKNKVNAQFYMARLKHFPNILQTLTERYPEIVVNNSYVTKCLPNYYMVPHIDPNRNTAIIIPLGDNKGKLSYFFRSKKIFTHTYKSPVLSRVNWTHSAENHSNEIRYGLTLEIPGSYWSNFFNYR